ncbi:MAG: class D beta-lactamase [Chitinophagaceae bacterium]
MKIGTFKHCFTIVVIIVLLQSCSSSNITNEEGLKKFFDENKVEGTFALYNNGQGNFNIYNLSRFKDSSYTPASTFKIVNSLIGLQTGIISSTKMQIKWDGIDRGMPEWNKDLTMEEAFKVSCVPYYQEVARKIGKDTMQAFLDSLSYGTKKITAPIDTFWLDNSLKIKPDEQLGLVKKLYFEQLPFTKTTMQAVKKVMIQENNSNYTLAYKTGWGYKENGKSIGWVVGWIEENKHPSFFVLNLEGEHNIDMVNIRKNIMMNCLKQLGYLQGKK